MDFIDLYNNLVGENDGGKSCLAISLPVFQTAGSHPRSEAYAFVKAREVTYHQFDVCLTCRGVVCNI